MSFFSSTQNGRPPHPGVFPPIQVHTLEIFQKELNESERSVFQAVVGLQRALQGDYRDVVNMKESSRQRLEALREAAIKVRSGGARQGPPYVVGSLLPALS